MCATSASFACNLSSRVRSLSRAMTGRTTTFLFERNGRSTETVYIEGERRGSPTSSFASRNYQVS